MDLDSGSGEFRMQGNAQSISDLGGPKAHQHRPTSHHACIKALEHGACRERIEPPPPKWNTHQDGPCCVDCSLVMDRDIVRGQKTGCTYRIRPPRDLHSECPSGAIQSELVCWIPPANTVDVEHCLCVTHSRCVCKPR